MSDELNSIKASLPEKKASLRDTLRLCCEKTVFFPFLLVVFLYMFQHLCGGGSTATAYAGLFFKAAGIADPDVTATYAWGAASFVGVIFAAFLVEVAGRKLLLAVSAAGMFLSTGLFGVHFYITRPSLCANSSTNLSTLMEDSVSCNPHLSPLAIVSFIVFGLAFSIGVGPVPWILLSEYLPLRVRGVAGGIAVAANKGTAAVITGSFLSFSQHVGAWFAWWTLSLFNLFGFVVIVLFVVETKGKKLEDIQQLFKITPCHSHKR